ncbi:hypothetical protein NQZ68_000061 [Dissostichus eleginoides]|nr:hypothetical protein NQZ68_000061 [Dissostichus eleginoides]
MISGHFLPREVLWLPISPPIRDNLHSSIPSPSVSPARTTPVPWAAPVLSAGLQLLHGCPARAYFKTTSMFLHGFTQSEALQRTMRFRRAALIIVAMPCALSRCDRNSTQDSTEHHHLAHFSPNSAGNAGVEHHSGHLTR